MALLPRTPENLARLHRERLGYVNSSAVKFAIMMRLPGYWRRTDLSAIFRTAQGIDVLSACTDPVRWWQQPKATGGWRPICSPPLKIWLGQRIARDLVVAQLTPSDGVFDWPNRGPHRYVSHLAKAIRTSGPYVMCMDIQSCYPSVDIDAVYRLNLIPPELIRSAIDHREFRYHRVQSTEEGRDTVVLPIVLHEDPTDPSGLLQGGPASSSILAALLQGSTETVAPGIPCQSYSDNYSIVGSTEAVVAEAARDVARYVTGLRSGRLEFRQEVHDIRVGFDHLGFRFEESAGGVAILLPDRKLYRALEKLEMELEAGWAIGARDGAACVRRVLAPHWCITRHDTEVLADHAEVHLHGLNVAHLGPEVVLSDANGIA